MGELLTGHVKTDENPADILTKVVSGVIKRKNWCKCTYMIFMMVGNYWPSYEVLGFWRFLCSG